MSRVKVSERISDKQWAFLNALRDDPSISRTEAARRAGYANPAVEGSKLVNPNQYPLVAMEYEKVLQERRNAAKLSGDGVLEYIHNTMTFEPLKFFSPGKNGRWEITLEGLKALPREIGMLIEHVEVVDLELPDGTKVQKASVRLVSKTVAMSLAAKHQLGEKVSVSGTVVHVNWDELATMQQRRLAQAEEVKTVDPVEQRIEQERKALPPKQGK